MTKDYIFGKLEGLLIAGKSISGHDELFDTALDLVDELKKPINQQSNKDKEREKAVKKIFSAPVKNKPVGEMSSKELKKKLGEMIMESNGDFGDRLSMVMDNLGLTLRQVAEAVDLSTAEISVVKNGKRTLKPSTIMKKFGICISTDDAEWIERLRKNAEVRIKQNTTKGIR